jgi:type I restriction enzyme S subunit
VVAPSGWREVCLGQVAQVKTGARNNQDKDPEGRYPFYVRSANVESIDSYSYEGEAILIPGEGGIGEIFHYVNGPHEVHQRVYRVSDFTPETFPKFVFFYLRSYFGPHAMRNTVKATVDSLRLPTFLEFELLLPPLEEQAAIAEALSDADAAIEAIDALIAKKRDVKQAAMQQLLTGRTRLPGFSDEWEECLVRDVASFGRRTIDPLHLGDEEVEHYSLPAFDAGAAERVPASRIGSLKLEIDREVVLVSRLNPRIPRVWLVRPSSRRSLASTEFAPLAPIEGRCSGRYLMHLIRADQFMGRLAEMAIGTTGSHQRVQPSDLLKLEVAIPLCEEQDAIAEVLSDMDSEIEALVAERDKMRLVKQGMMQELLSGRVRLV